ncbi:hypothetical protein POM88_017597 [Heracleum sosnowskyi]|uniref:Uncharacterized protein n=1 Tax=Heracleum sosnowskyi TaxID=360622 RepID=A0AAD8MY45_9APIA|nr:hypothetical protein POM88_017597 [Heracleum sosnowskyi]
MTRGSSWGNFTPSSPTNEEETLSSENLEWNHPETTEAAKSPESKKNEHPNSPSTKSEQGLDTEAELAKLESEFGKVNTAEEICDLEIDELERQLRSGEMTSSKLISVSGVHINYDQYKWSS